MRSQVIGEPAVSDWSVKRQLVTGIASQDALLGDPPCRRRMLGAGSQAPQVPAIDAFSSQNKPKLVEVTMPPLSTNVWLDPGWTRGSVLVRTVAVAVDICCTVTT